MQLRCLLLSEGGEDTTQMLNCGKFRLNLSLLDCGASQSTVCWNECGQKHSFCYPFVVKHSLVVQTAVCSVSLILTPCACVSLGVTDAASIN